MDSNFDPHWQDRSIYTLLSASYRRQQYLYELYHYKAKGEAKGKSKEDKGKGEALNFLLPRPVAHVEKGVERNKGKGNGKGKSKEKDEGKGNGKDPAKAPTKTPTKAPTKAPTKIPVIDLLDTIDYISRSASSFNGWESDVSPPESSRLF